MPPHPLVDFEIQKYYRNSITLMVFIQEIVYTQKDDRAYKINLDE